MAQPVPDHVKEIVKLIETQGYAYHRHDLFSDAMATAAISISNAVDLRHRDEREARYMQIVGKYDKATVDMFPKVMAHTVLALEDKPQDALGQVFSQLELGNEARGQFFTPYEVSKLMAQMQVSDGLRDTIRDKGYVNLSEPACGSGGMVIAFAEAMKDKGLNYQQALHVQAIDVDERAAHMAYIQFSLMHIPAEVIVGNTLSGEVREVWHTPAHVLGGWDMRLQSERAIDAVHGLERRDEPPPKPQLQPRTIEPSGPGQQLDMFAGLEP